MLFSGSNISSAYRLGRPIYPAHLVKHILNFYHQPKTDGNIQTICSEEIDEENCFVDSQHQKVDLIVDVGCGSGQLTHVLADYANLVIGTDISKTQLNESSGRSNVKFRLSDCYSIPVEDHSVDIITVAQAAHWFDIEKFYCEAQRCLKTGGVLAIIGYTFNYLQNIRNEKEVNQILHRFYKEDLSPYWDCRRKILNNRYLDYPNFSAEFQRSNYKMISTMNMATFFTYLNSMSAYKTSLEKNPNIDLAQNVLQEIIEKMDEDPAELDNISVQVKWPLFSILSRKLN